MTDYPPFLRIDDEREYCVNCNVAIVQKPFKFCRTCYMQHRRMEVIA